MGTTLRGTMLNDHCLLLSLAKDHILRVKRLPRSFEVNIDIVTEEDNDSHHYMPSGNGSRNWRSWAMQCVVVNLVLLALLCSQHFNRISEYKL